MDVIILGNKGGDKNPYHGYTEHVRGLPKIIIPPEQKCVAPYYDDGALADTDIYRFQGFDEYEGLRFCWGADEWQVAYAKGPANEGDPDTNSFTYDWRFYRHKPSGEYFYGRDGGPYTEADDYFTPDADCDSLTFSFEANGRPVLCVCHDGRFTIKRYQGGVMQTYGPFEGYSPQMWYNGEILDYIADAGWLEPIIYYLKRGENKLFARVYRDNFGTEYTAIDGLPHDLRELFIEGLVAYHLYLNISTGRRGLRIESDIYPKEPHRVGDNQQMTVQFQTGSYDPGAVSTGPHDDKVDNTIEFQSGSYTLVIQSSGPHDDKVGNTVAFGSGTYTAVIQVTGPHDDKVGNTTAFNSGTYTVGIQNAGTFDDKISNTVAFLQGSYYV